MKKTYEYTVVFEQDEDGIYVADVPALPGCHSEGRTLKEAEKNIREAILCYLEGLQVIGEEIPIEEPAHLPRAKAIQVSLSTV
jgi:predicted RNase H-like HicB family nuclease